MPTERSTPTSKDTKTPSLSEMTDFSRLMKRTKRELSSILVDLGHDPGDLRTKRDLAGAIVEIAQEYLVRAEDAEPDDVEDDDEAKEPPEEDEELEVCCHGVIPAKPGKPAHPCGKDLIATNDWNVVHIKEPAGEYNLEYLTDNAYCSGCAMKLKQRGAAQYVQRVELDAEEDR